MLKTTKRKFVGFFDGARLLLRNARFVFRERVLWKYVVIPFFINAVLFAAFLYLAANTLGGFLLTSLPASWWAMVLTVAVVGALLAGILYFGAAVFVFFGSLVSAPFYDMLAQRVIKMSGGAAIERPLGQELAITVKNSLYRFAVYALLQGGVLLLYLIPAVGPVVSVGLGFVVTAVFLAVSFFDYGLSAKGMRVAEQFSWITSHAGYVLGFGAITFGLLAVPVLNLLIPPIAVVAGVNGVFERVEGLDFSHEDDTTNP
jgi:CysZ protein